MGMGRRTMDMDLVPLPNSELKGRKEYKFRESILPKVNLFFPSFSEVELTGKGTTEITRTITKLSFVKVDSDARRGIPFFGQVRYFSVHKSNCTLT